MTWEYETYNEEEMRRLLPPGDLAEQLNHLGAKGWELAGIKHENPREERRDLQCVYIFKRAVKK